MRKQTQENGVCQFMHFHAQLYTHTEVNGLFSEKYS